jgi:hypothetical protein
MKNRKTILRLSVIAVGLLFYGAVYLQNKPTSAAEYASRKSDPEKARAAFLETYKVFSAARCVNCHPAGDAPLQGETGARHAFLVERGKDGKGFAALRCTTCHQEKNSPGEHAPPGAKDWHLPPPEMKMTFEKVPPRQLCEQLKNPRLNGGRDLGKVGDHLETALVRWAWEPGGNRAVPPISYKDFVMNFELWRANGAACPE